MVITDRMLLSAERIALTMKRVSLVLSMSSSDLANRDGRMLLYSEPHGTAEPASVRMSEKAPSHASTVQHTRRTLSHQPLSFRRRCRRRPSESRSALRIISLATKAALAPALARPKMPLGSSKKVSTTSSSGMARSKDTKRSTSP